MKSNHFSTALPASLALLNNTIALSNLTAICPNITLMLMLSI